MCTSDYEIDRHVGINIGGEIPRNKLVDDMELSEKLSLSLVAYRVIVTYYLFCSNPINLTPNNLKILEKIRVFVEH